MTDWCDRQELLDKLIADLRGTCQSIEEVAEYWQINELSFEDLQYIESEVFLCEGCGWWCSTSECYNSDDSLLCEDCYDEEEDGN